MSDMQTFQGSCHCGNVRYQVKMPAPDKAYSCNCSICSKMGARMAFVGGDQFELLQGKESLKDYLFHKKHIHHEFCTNCGIRSFAHALDKEGKQGYMINLRCVDGVDAEKLPVEWFDGKSA